MKFTTFLLVVGQPDHRGDLVTIEEVTECCQALHSPGREVGLLVNQITEVHPVDIPDPDFSGFSIDEIERDPDAERAAQTVLDGWRRTLAIALEEVSNMTLRKLRLDDERETNS